MLNYEVVTYQEGSREREREVGLSQLVIARESGRLTNRKQSCCRSRARSASQGAPGAPLAQGMTAKIYCGVSVAGSSWTDSPQPQAEVWLGLLNTNWAESLSVL
jgi:hypothetical protein